LLSSAAAAGSASAKIAQILYFKAKPGQFEAYNRYIRELADPALPWSRLRLFTVASKEQREAFSRKKDEAGARVFPRRSQAQGQS
jgi:hypothetical protein